MRIGTNINGLRRGVAHHQDEGQMLLREVDGYFSDKETLRQQEFRDARIARQNKIAEIIEDGKGRHQRAMMRYDKILREDLHKWKMQMEVDSAERKCALLEEEKSWRDAWIAVFVEGETNVDITLRRLGEAFYARSKERERILQKAAVMMQQGLRDGRWITRTNSPNNRPSVRQDAMSTASEVEHEAAYEVPRPPESEHRWLGHAQVGYEADRYEGTEAEVGVEMARHKGHVDPQHGRRRVSTRERQGTSKSKGSLSLKNSLDLVLVDEKDQQEIDCTSSLHREAQRWTDAVANIQDEAKEQDKLFDKQFLAHQQTYDDNRRREQQDVDSDRNLWDEYVQWRTADFKENEKRRQGDYDQLIAEECESWRVQLNSQEIGFHTRFTDYAVGRCNYWTNHLAAFREERNQHSARFFGFYQHSVFGAEVFRNAAVSVARDQMMISKSGLQHSPGTVGSPQEPITLLAGLLTDSPLSFTDSQKLYSDNLQGQSSSVPLPQEHTAMLDGLFTESPQSFTDSQLIDPDVQNSPIFASRLTQRLLSLLEIEDVQLPEEPALSNARIPGQKFRSLSPALGLYVASEVGAESRPNWGYHLVASPPSSVLALSELDTSGEKQTQNKGVFLKVLCGLGHFATTSCSLWPVSLVVGGFLKGASNLFEEIRTEWVFYKRQAHRRQILKEQYLEQALSLPKILAELQETFDNEQAKRRTYARESETERDQAFRRLEDERDKWPQTMKNKDKKRFDRYSNRFLDGQSRRRINVKKCLTRMREELRDSIDERRRKCLQLPVVFDGIISEQVRLFEAEEEWRDAFVRRLVYNMNNRRAIPVYDY
ncbi:hypothetical protein DXG01_002615 [Tephrocybe rancida]|nr:hypothetical protein DXG01_002615 [Tephrocybe rancida]